MSAHPAFKFDIRLSDRTNVAEMCCLARMTVASLGIYRSEQQQHGITYVETITCKASA
jgi:hypothetical protein